MTLPLRQYRRLLLATLFLSSATLASGANYYFRPEDGDLPLNGEAYQWNTTVPNWTLDAAGENPALWNNDGTSTLFLQMSPAPTTTYLELTEAIYLNGITYDNEAGSNSFQIRSADPEERQTLHFTSGSTIGTQSTGSNSILFSNLNITGSFHLSGGNITHAFTNTSFTDEITSQRPVNVRGGLTNLKVQLTGGSGSVTLDSSSATVARISGIGGINRTSNGSGGTLTLDQTDHTVLTGRLTGGAWVFTKTGSGTFIVTGEGVHNTTYQTHVNGGAFYIDGTMTTAGANATHNRINIATGATFGGKLNTVRTLVLAGATSTVDPGMASLDENDNLIQHAGVLTIEKVGSAVGTAGGLSATNGGTFNFHLDEQSLLGDLVNSRIDLLGGDVNFGGEVTVNLIGLNAGLLETGVAYTLIDASTATAFTNTANWTLGLNTTGLGIESFGFNGANQLQVVFIPEPSTALLLLGSVGLGLWWNRRRRG